MSILMVNETQDFNSLKETLQITDGNLASHLKALEKSGMIEVRKQFLGRKPNTSYVATKKGKSDFSDHLNALEELINKSK
jgi:DNA-binding HxlR family transcriptional regulator